MRLIDRLRSASRRTGSPEWRCPERLPICRIGFYALYARVRPFTMTSIERLYALYEAVRYVIAADIPGDIVECGVWRGGSSMMAAMTLREIGARRPWWLYDTFEGMPPPGEHDIRYSGESAKTLLDSAERVPGAWNEWAWTTLEDVRANMASTGYDDLEYVVGPARRHDPSPRPGPNRLVAPRHRLELESTRHEIQHLYPRLSEGGVLIIDDYGHWQGARRAIDEYFAGRPILLNRDPLHRSHCD